MEDKAYGSQLSAIDEVIFITNTVRTTQLITSISNLLINRSNPSDGRLLTVVFLIDIFFMGYSPILIVVLVLCPNSLFSKDNWPA